MEAGTSGVLSISDSGRRVPAEYGEESHASSSVEEWISPCLSSCSRSDRPLVELSVEPAGFSGRCTGVSVPLRVVPSSTLSSNRCLGIAFLSRADREIAVFRHVAPPSRLRLEFPRETASSEVRGEGREPLADKAGELTLLSRSGGEKGLR